VQHGREGGWARANRQPDRAPLSGTPVDTGRIDHGTTSRTGERLQGGTVNFIAPLCAFAVGGLLGTGVVDKLIHWSPFVLTLEQNPFVPASLAAAAGGGVVAVESFVAVTILIPRTRRTGFLTASLLFGVFTLVIAALLFLTPGARCGCTFLLGYDTADPRHLVLNILLTILSVFIWRTEPYDRSPSEAGLAVQPPASLSTLSPKRRFP
jgi:hypothetical protein